MDTVTGTFGPRLRGRRCRARSSLGPHLGAQLHVSREMRVAVEHLNDRGWAWSLRYDLWMSATREQQGSAHVPQIMKLGLQSHLPPLLVQTSSATVRHEERRQSRRPSAPG